MEGAFGGNIIRASMFGGRAPLKPVNAQQREQPLKIPTVFGLRENPPLPTRDGHMFPIGFDPRQDSNMHHQEKVDKWMQQVPTQPSAIVKDSWDNRCYKPLISISDSVFSNERLEDFDFGEYGDVIEFQARAITFLENKMYLNDEENIRSPDHCLDDNCDMTSGNHIAKCLKVICHNDDCVEASVHGNQRRATPGTPLDFYNDVSHYEQFTNYRLK